MRPQRGASGGIGSEREGSAALGRAREGSGCKKENVFTMKMGRCRVRGGSGCKKPLFFNENGYVQGAQWAQVAKNKDFIMRTNRFRVLGVRG